MHCVPSSPTDEGLQFTISRNRIMETFIIVHPDFPECVGDDTTLAAWGPLGWKRKDDAKAEEPQADKPVKAKK